MEKVKISLPTPIVFEVGMRIPINMINYGGHLGNSSYLDIAHEARLQYLESIQASEMDFGGKSLIMANAVLDFKKELFYGDQIIVRIGIEHITKLSFDIIYLIVRKLHTHEEDIVAHLKTGMVCFDYQSRKISPIPENMLQKIEQKKQ